MLVAEDEELEREAVCAILSAAHPGGIAIHRASNGAEALRLARDGELSAAFLDIRMPGMDGIEAARVIREIRPELPIVFLTACDSFEYARRAVSLGIDEYILKPASNSEILDALDRMLSARRRAAERREGERAKDEALTSTAGYLRGRIAEGFADDRLDSRCLRECMKLEGCPGLPFFLAAFRLPDGKSGTMSPGFLRAVLSRIAARAAETGGVGGQGTICGASARYAYALCRAASGNDADGALEAQARKLAATVRDRAMGELGVSPCAGVAFGPVDRLIEAARSAADLAGPGKPVVLLEGEAEGVPGSRGGAGTDEAGRRLARRALAYLEGRLNGDISLDAAAAALKVSASHLSRVLSRVGGAGFSDTLALLRVRKAEALLRGGASVKEAAGLVGYRDPAYFSRVFRRLSGKSPTEFLEEET